MRRLLSAVLPAIIAAFLLAAAPRAHAELVWAPGVGWHVEGTAPTTTLGGEDGRNALDMMNKARTAEEAHSNRKAIGLY
ncbi:MAG: outer membrane protein assembly factor BamD, partial [Opitutales bacterium]